MHFRPLHDRVVVRRIEPNMVEDRNRAGNILTRRSRILGRLSQRHGG